MGEAEHHIEAFKHLIACELELIKLRNVRREI